MRTKPRIVIWYFIVGLLLINYQIVTIILKDRALFKYLRDLLLVSEIFLTIFSFKNSRVITGGKRIVYVQVALFCGLTIIGFLRTDSMVVGVTFLRRYLYSLIAMCLIISMKSVKEKDFLRYFQFIICFLSALSLWGIFQAWFLKDVFLIKLGYPIKEHTGTLRDSFYFGNLGIQRVVSTTSNSNVFALILGTTILVAIINAKEILSRKKQRILFYIICVAYVLTFSRANFLAMIIVGLIVSWKYIPARERKRIIKSFALFSVAFFVGLITQNGYVMKITTWIFNTFTGREASSANRVSIWIEAFNAVKAHPFGIGFGHVGAFAQINMAEKIIHAENSYLAMAIDLGVVGFIVYMSLLISIIRLFKRSHGKYGRTGVAIILYVMICFMFSNHVYDMEATGYIFILVGMLLNLSKPEKENMLVEQKVFSYSV